MIINRKVVSGGATVKQDINFYDYDGTLVESWTLSELQSKTALPDNPSHTGLVAQGWNWTLAGLKSQNTEMNVGQMYKTSSGLTEIDITLTRVTGLTVTCNMAGNKTWGDGTTDALTSHTYTDYGDYTLTCDGTAIAVRMFGTTDSVMNYYCKDVRIGERVTSVSWYAFQNCRSLQTLTMPQSVTSFGGYALQYNMLLKSVTIPQRVTSIGNNAFQNCRSLQTLTMPQSVTSFGDNAFTTCFALPLTLHHGLTSIGAFTFNSCISIQSVAMPQSLTSIGQGAFYSCAALKYDFTSATSVPTLGSSTVFSGISDICKIIVPDALYDDWIVATNWSTYADYIYKASEVE